MALFLFVCRLDGLLPTSGKNFMSIAPFEIYLEKKRVFNACLCLSRAFYYNDVRPQETNVIFLLIYSTN